MQGLVKYEAARYALAQCKAVDEVKDWADKAAAMQAYGRMAKDKALETDAAEIRIRAERRLGEILAASEKNTGAQGIGTSAVPKENRTPTLAESGVDKKLSARSQRLAAVPEPQFEKEIGEWRDRVQQEGVRVTARLEAAGDAALKSKAPKTISDGPDYKAKYDALVQDFDELKTTISVLETQLEAALAIDTHGHIKALEIEIRKRKAVESQRDELQRAQNEQNKTVRYWKRRSEKAESELGRQVAVAEAEY